MRELSRASLLTPAGSVFEVRVGSSKLEYTVDEGSSQIVLVVNAGGRMSESVPPKLTHFAGGSTVTRLAHEPVDQRTCHMMLECFSRALGAPVSYPATSVLACGSGVEPALAVLLTLTARTTDEMCLAYAFKSVSWELRRTIDTVVIISATAADGHAMLGKLTPWLVYLNPRVKYAMASSASDIESAMGSCVSHNDAGILVICESSTDEAELSGRLGLKHIMELQAGSGRLAVSTLAAREPTTLADAALGESLLVELHCETNRHTGADAAGWFPLAAWVEEDSAAWPWSDTRAAPSARDPPHYQCGPDFDASLEFSSFYSQWAPKPAGQIRRPLRMHGVWTPRCDTRDCKGTVIFCPGVNWNTDDVQRSSMQAFRRALFGVPAKVPAEYLPHVRGVKPLPDSVSCFRCYWPNVPNASIYQLPCGVAMLATVIDSIVQLRRDPIVLVGHSLAGAIVSETVARVIDHYPAGSIAAVCLLAPQVPGLHCDYKSGNNTMETSCKRLGEKGVPLTVLHGTADKTVPMKCGEQVVGWHAEGARLRRGSAGLSNFYPVEGDVHGLVTATHQLRDIVAAHLRV